MEYQQELKASTYRNERKEIFKLSGEEKVAQTVKNSTLDTDYAVPEMLLSVALEG